MEDWFFCQFVHYVLTEGYALMCNVKKVAGLTLKPGREGSSTRVWVSRHEVCGNLDAKEGEVMGEEGLECRVDVGGWRVLLAYGQVDGVTVCDPEGWLTEMREFLCRPELRQHLQLGHIQRFASMLRPLPPECPEVGMMPTVGQQECTAIGGSITHDDVAALIEGWECGCWCFPRVVLEKMGNQLKFCGCISSEEDAFIPPCVCL